MDVAVQFESWTQQLPGLEALAEAAILQILADLDNPKLGELSLAFVNDSDIVSLAHHVTHLIIHGFLHLQGYDHETDKAAADMEALEIAALAALNIDNPYEIHD